MDYKRIEFPRAFAFAIDDLGWNEGSNLSETTPSGPHRAGVKRTFDLNDYKAIVKVAQAAGVRIQSLFILGEMDRENVLANYPTTTQYRNSWNNTYRVNQSQKEIMKYVVDQAAYMEFGLHGTGHEYWADDGKQRRAEWYNLTDREPWPEESLRQHIQGFKEIMAQYKISTENGHSFPESFVPCAYSYYWNPTGNYSLGKLLSEAGVKYANTDFAQIPELLPPSEINGGGFDYGTHVINRLNYGNHWYELNSLPKVPVDMQWTDIVESHWPNWLAQDDFLQPSATNQWITYYKTIQRSPGRYIAKNTEQLHSQWLYKKYTLVQETTPGIVEIDNTRMLHEPYQYSMLGNMVLKVKLDKGEHISSATLNEGLIPAYLEDEGYGFIYLPILEKKRYTLKYVIGPDTMNLSVYNDGTYNIYNLYKKDGNVFVDVKVYGTQMIKIKTGKPLSVVSHNKRLKVMEYDYASECAHVLVSSANMQGVTGTLQLTY